MIHLPSILSLKYMCIIFQLLCWLVMFYDFVLGLFFFSAIVSLKTIHAAQLPLSLGGCTLLSCSCGPGDPSETHPRPTWANRDYEGHTPPCEMGTQATYVLIFLYSHHILGQNSLWNKVFSISLIVQPFMHIRLIPTNQLQFQFNKKYFRDIRHVQNNECTGCNSQGSTQ